MEIELSSIIASVVVALIVGVFTFYMATSKNSVRYDLELRELSKTNIEQTEHIVKLSEALKHKSERLAVLESKVTSLESGIIEMTNLYRQESKEFNRVVTQLSNSMSALDATMSGLKAAFERTAK